MNMHGIKFNDLSRCCLLAGSVIKKKQKRAAHLAGMPPVAAAVHVGSASSVHVSPLRRAAAVHGTTSVAHVTPHWSGPGGASQARQWPATAAPSAEVAAVVEATPEGGRGQEATWWAEEAATTRTRSCRDTQHTMVSICRWVHE